EIAAPLAEPVAVAAPTPAEEVVASAPPAAVAAEPFEAPPVAVPAPVAPPADLDVDALSDIASAMQGPTGAPATGAPAAGIYSQSAPTLVPHLPSLAESEDGKATIPMVMPFPEEPVAPVRAAPSVLDEEPTSRKSAAGIGVVLLGVLGLGAFALLAVVGIWWTMSRGDQDESQAGREITPVEAPKVLPAAAPPPVEPPPVVEPVVPPVETPPAAVAVAPPPVATTAAVSKPPPATTAKAPPSTSGANASTTPRGTTSTTPSGSRTGTIPATADAGTANVTSDSVWGTPTAPTSGFLRVVTDPEGATVYVNDTAKGKTPVTVELPYGAHQVRVVRAGYKTETRDVNIRVRELTVPFNLKPDMVTGQVNVYGPDGFRVVVDGHDMGPMPVTVQVSEGVRQFKLVGSDGSACNLPKEIKFKAAGRPETITLACP
ncbi:MAG: PEGA domain-containing protein, partial [Pseudomonadota bacterium]|nr:PEGA domain-containing protein [Pseudomonadota bacterium]